MDEELKKVIEIYAHNGKENGDDIVTCKFLDGAMDEITPIILSSMCVALIEKTISSMPEELQVEMEETVIAMLFYMIKERYNIFDMSGEGDK
jgi:hypothetical protein